MELSVAVVIALVVFIVIWIGLRAYKIHTFSAIAVSLLIGLFVLLALANPRDIQNFSSGQYQFYTVLVGIIVIILIIYILCKGLSDRCMKKDKAWSIFPSWSAVPAEVVA
jgi:CDP-diglyceride synthetase